MALSCIAQVKDARAVSSSLPVSTRGT
jgi:hypothetical protein